MSSINEDLGLQKQITTDDGEEAAKYHRKAPEFYDQNKVSYANGSSKSALNFFNSANKPSTATQKHSST